jgi:hypoxanthine phosphoribosyltransferase
VLVLDDILDEGQTLQSIVQYCESQGASKIISAVLLRKNHDRCIDEQLTDNIALYVEDEYVFGFGMDYDGKYRQLDSIYALKD